MKILLGKIVLRYVVNYFDGMKEFFKYLVKLGHQKIAYIDYVGPKIKENISRYNAYIDKYNLIFNEKYIVFGEPP
ncbi:MAG: hypothetical protein FH762_16165 [Firmicutes bacterium]|nr:hypothetical protein [Bacillota bacterium]